MIVKTNHEKEHSIDANFALEPPKLARYQLVRNKTAVNGPSLYHAGNKYCGSVAAIRIK